MDLLSLFKNSKNRESYTAGSTIFKEGEPGQLMYVLIDGEVEILVGDTVVETLEPGRLFGEMVLVDSLPRSATAQAKTDCVMVYIDERQFLFLVQEHPTFALHVLGVGCARLRRMNQKV